MIQLWSIYGQIVVKKSKKLLKTSKKVKKIKKPVFSTIDKNRLRNDY